MSDTISTEAARTIKYALFSATTTREHADTLEDKLAARSSTWRTPLDASAIKGAVLALADGTLFRGIGFGASCVRFGEVCFNTSMTGYQEILTDPSYCGLGVVMTYPHIGYYGTVPEDDASSRCWAEALVVRQMSPVASNWRWPATCG